MGEIYIIERENKNFYFPLKKITAMHLLHMQRNYFLLYEIEGYIDHYNKIPNKGRFYE